MNFGDSDIMRMRFSPNPDDPESVLYFMHCDNPRHHTVAMMEAPTPPSGLVHAMVEVRPLSKWLMPWTEQLKIISISLQLLEDT